MIEHSFPFFNSVSHRTDHFYRFVPVYEPVHLELKRMITQKTRGNLEGITMRAYLPSATPWRYIESLVLAFWLFGEPDGWNVSAEKAPAGEVCRLGLVCWSFPDGAGMAMEITAAAVPDVFRGEQDKKGIKETATEGWLSFSGGEIHFRNSTLPGGSKLFRITPERGIISLPLADGKGSENMERQISKGELQEASKRIFPGHWAERYLQTAIIIYSEALHTGEKTETE